MPKSQEIDIVFGGLEFGDFVDVFHDRKEEKYFFFDGAEKVYLNWSEFPFLIPKLNGYFMHPKKKILLRLSEIVEI